MNPKWRDALRVCVVMICLIIIACTVTSAILGELSPTAKITTFCLVGIMALIGLTPWKTIDDVPIITAYVTALGIVLVAQMIAGDSLGSMVNTVLYWICVPLIMILTIFLCPKRETKVS